MGAAKRPPRVAYLKGWKEIANYFGTSVRTVQRYEQERAMPVLRPGVAPRGPVLATKEALDAWANTPSGSEAFRRSPAGEHRPESIWGIMTRTQAEVQLLWEAMTSTRAEMQLLREETLALRVNLRSSLDGLHKTVSGIDLMNRALWRGGPERGLQELKPRDAANLLLPEVSPLRNRRVQ